MLSPRNSLLNGLFLFVVGYFAATMIGGALISLVPGWREAYEGFLHGRADAYTCMMFRWVQGAVSLTWFALPAFLWASMHGRGLHFLRMKQAPGFTAPLLAGLLLIVSLPLAQALLISPDQVSLPESMKGLEDFLREQGKQSIASSQHLLSDTSSPGLIANLFFMALIPALTEEMLFRGFLQQALGRFMRPALAISLTAAAFSLMHMQLLIFFPRLLLGFLLGYVFYHSGKLWVSIAAHFAYNGITVLIAWMATNGILDRALMADDFKFPLWLALASAAGMIAVLYLFRRSVPKAEGSPFNDLSPSE